MTKVLVRLFLVASLSMNLSLVAKAKWDRWMEVGEDDRVLLGEMTRMVTEHSQYRTVEKREIIRSIEGKVERDRPFPFGHVVHVRTDLQTYVFNCADERCSKVRLKGTGYSRYERVKPRLPLKE